MEWLSAVDEQKVLAETSFLASQGAKFQSTADPQVAANVATIYRANPWMKPGEILALAKARAGQPVVSAASDLSASQVGARTDPEKPRSKGWLERNLYDKLKTTSRWTFASLNTAADLTQNVASQIFNPNDTDGFDIGFKATQLGTMLATAQGEIDAATGQPISAGSGLFFGGTAAERQSERARRVRGEINGHAWTIGRGAADAVFTPGSREYTFLSGFLDAAVTVGTDPTLYAGKIGKAVKAGRAVIPSLQTAEEIAAAAKLAGRSERVLAGLDQAEQIAWDGSKFRRWFTQDSRAIRLTNELAGNDDAFDILSRVFKYQIDLDTAKQLAGATDGEQIAAIIGQNATRLDNAAVGLLPTDIRKIPGATRAEWVKDRIPGINSWRNSRLLTDMPGNTWVYGSSADNVAAVKTYANFFDTIGLKTASPEGKAAMQVVMDAFDSGDPAAFKKVQELFEGTVGKVLMDEGLSGQEVTALFARVNKTMDETRAFYVNEMGDIVDGEFMKGAIDSGMIDSLDPTGVEQLKNPRLMGPGAVVEMMDRSGVLPDIRVLRRLTGTPMMRRALANRKGDPRAALALTEFLQNEIWKPAALATGGYIFRNMFDAQIRIASIGKEGFFNHPWEYMKLVMHKKAPSNLFGRDFDGWVDNFVKKADEETDAFAEAMTTGVTRHIDDPAAAMRRGTRNSGFKVVEKVADKEIWEQGLTQELRQVGQDTVMNAVAKGIPTDEIITYLRTDPKGQEALRKLSSYLKNGVKVVGDDGNFVTMKFKDINDDVLKLWIERLSASRVALKTGGNADLRFAVAYRRVPNGARESVDPNDFADGDFLDGPLKRGVGSLVDLKDSGVHGKPSLAVITDVGDGSRWQVQRVSTHDVFDSSQGKSELQDLIRKVGDDPASKLPKHVKIAEQSVPFSEMKESERHALNAKNKFVNFFFDRVYGTAARKFERSPVYRQFYYQHVTDNVDLLSRKEAGLLDQLVRGQAQVHGMSPEDFVGGKKNWKRLQTNIASADGVGSVKQLEEYAQIRALNLTKDALFDASGRNNLEDMMRIMVPFGSAWREILTTYGKYAIENPARIRKAQLVYNGATDFDPDNDGQGFFYRDPVTGEMSFNIPMSGTLTKLLTGLDAPMQANVKGLSMGAQIFPAIGPVAQIAASKIIPDTPAMDNIVEVLLPYGRKGSNALSLGWVTKAYSAWEAKPGKLESIYGNTYIETVRALSASGDYDLSDINDKERLLEDAKGKARILTAFRALSQFLGPSAGTPEFQIPTDQGDIMASALTAAFHKLQTENYDTAVQRFLQIYGDDALLYVSSKTRAVTPGIGASDQFGDWELNNKGLLSKYPRVAAYFAPGGDDFSFSVWERQTRTGSRERLTAAEMVELAQKRIGSALYRDLRKQVGSSPNTVEADWLRAQRKKINALYPGFPEKSVFVVGEFERDMKQLEQVVSDSKLDGNTIAEAVREYLGYRKRAGDEVAAQGGKSLDAERFIELRQWLYNHGVALADAVPEFARIWDQLLSGEVD